MIRKLVNENERTEKKEAEMRRQAYDKAEVSKGASKQSIPEEKAK